MEEPFREPPCANALLIAERVYRDVETSEWIIAGVFNRITVDALPAIHDRIDVFFQVTNVTGPVDLRLRLEHSDGTVLLDVGGPISSKSPLNVIEAKITLRGVPFKKAGKYFVQLMSQEQLLTAAPLHVKVKGQAEDADTGSQPNRDDQRG